MSSTENTGSDFVTNFFICSQSTFISSENHRSPLFVLVFSCPIHSSFSVFINIYNAIYWPPFLCHHFDLTPVHLTLTCLDNHCYLVTNLCFSSLITNVQYFIPVILCPVWKTLCHCFFFLCLNQDLYSCLFINWPLCIHGQYKLSYLIKYVYVHVSNSTPLNINYITKLSRPSGQH